MPHLSVKLESKVGAYLSGAYPLSTRIGSSLACKYYTKVKVAVTGNRFSSIQLREFKAQAYVSRMT
jgi:hypothetical protein